MPERERDRERKGVWAWHGKARSSRGLAQRAMAVSVQRLFKSRHKPHMSGGGGRGKMWEGGDRGKSRLAGAAGTGGGGGPFRKLMSVLCGRSLLPF